MTTRSNKALCGGLLAAFGLSAFSPLSLASASLLVAGAATWSAPASAQGTIKGRVKSPGDKGTVVKRLTDESVIVAPAAAAGKIRGKVVVSGDSGMVVRRLSDGGLILAPTDQEGAVYLSGLQPGDYEVKLQGDAAPSSVKVGPDGRLALVARRDEADSSDLEPADPRARKAKRAARKAVRNWVEPVEFGTAQPGSVFDTKAAMIDVNTADAASLIKDTNNSPEAAAFIVAERGRGGPYKDPLDFARRVGGTVSVDFGYASTRMGDTMIIARGTDPQHIPGFKTVAKSGVVELYGQKHNYVGHVTLLK